MKQFLKVAFLAAMPLMSSAQNFSGGFSFAMPPSDTTTSRFLPSFPPAAITNLDFVEVDGSGHFGVRGLPTRFFGTNLVADGAFPTKTKAWFIAGHLRKAGFNLVRFHHMDNPWSAASLFVQGQTTRQLNAVTLDRFEYFLARLKENGIYADINLHVSRTFRPADGIPDADSLPEFSKGVNYFDPAILALHKEFARQLLTHGNPYTGTALATDPVMAMVEITNENSLYRYWRDGRLTTFAEGGILTTRYARMLDSLWVGFLRDRYASTAALASAWNVGSVPSNGVNLLTNGSFEQASPSAGWIMEIHPPANASVARDSIIRHSGSYAARVSVSQSDGTEWHLQWKQIGLSVKLDSVYQISFSARSDSTRPVAVTLMKDVSPWNGYGSASMVLTTDWQDFRFSVRASETASGVVRLSFMVGKQAGSYWFDDIALTPAPVNGLLPDESLEAGTIRRTSYVQCAATTEQRVSDISSFYIALENEYFDRMRAFLKDSLGVRVPIVGTNWNVGPADMAVQSRLDYVDNHAYWDHPGFPGIPWSTTDWVINNTPMVQAPNGGTIPGLVAGVPVVGKPFTISEYNHSFPNRYQSEGMLFLTGYGAFHGADGLMLFDYNGSVDDWETDKIASYFNIYRNPAMTSLVPSCAIAFRAGMIAPARTTFVVNYAPADYLALPRRDDGGWVGPTLFDRTLALRYGVRAGSFSASTPFDPSILPPAPPAPYVSDTKEIVWNPAGVLTVATPQFVGATGFFDAHPQQAAGPLTISSADGFGTITWVSLDQDSLELAQRSLLTISTKAQNTGMIWDGTTTIHGNWGSPPTLVAPLKASLQLSILADSIRVYPLDPSGKDNGGFSTYAPVSANRFSVVIDQSVLQSVWFGIEKFGSGTVGVNRKGEWAPEETRLHQNFPNPFNPTTVIKYQLARGGQTSLRIYDLLGREVITLVDEVQVPGYYERRFDASLFSTGVYIGVLRAGATTFVQRMLLVK